jgi:hypothetical protein
MAQTAQVNININATAANKSVQDLSNQINKAGGSAASLRAELRQVTQELQGLEAGSARFTELSTRAGQLRDRIADTSAVIQATAGNAVENLGKALGNTISLGVAGFQALSSAQVLFGVENKDLQKSLAQMGALLNLSQAIETFGGLGDKLTEIKAGFTPLLTQLGLLKTTQTEVAVATTAADAAIVGEAVASEGAAVSTGVFATALNALPLVAIVTALGLLVAGLISYATSSDDASKAEEQRTKTLKAQREEEEKARKTIAEESAAYVSLIYQLKATNVGSEERKKLIKDINATYGTTLKNLSDEKEFQKQLNLEVVNYIAYQKAKFQLQKNEGLVQRNLEKQSDINKNILETERKIASLKSIKLGPDDLRAGKIAQDLMDLTKVLQGYQGQLDAANKRLESYGKVNLDVSATINELTNNGKKYGDQIDKNTKSTKDAGDALKDYESILNQIRSTQEENRKQEEELYKQRVEVFDKTIDIIEIEQKTREEAAIKEYEAVRIAIQKELEAKKISKEEKKRLNELEQLNEQNLTKALDVENQRRQLSIQLTTFKILEENRKRIEYLKLEEKALQNEIRFGDGNTTDTKIDLFQRERDAYIQNIDTKLLRSKYSNQIELKEFEELQKQKLQILTINLNEEALNKKNIAEADFNRQLDLEKKRIEANDDLNVKLEADRYGQLRATIEFKDKEIKAIAEMDEQARLNKLESLKKISQDLQTQIDKEVNIKKKADLQAQKNNADAALTTFNNNVLLADDLAEIRIKTEENLNTTIVNLDAEKNTKIVEADAQLNADIKAQTIKTEDEILDEKIKRLDEYLGYAQQAFQQASSLISQFAKQQQDIRTTQLEDAIALDKERIESQYAEGLISREQYDNALEQLDQKQQQQQLQIDRKNFRTEKALNIVGATIDGARAVLGAFAGTPGGIIVKTIAAALAGVFAATQIALIARQEFKAAGGGIVPGDGSGDIDSVPSRLAPGEAVINSRSTQAFLPLLSAINEVGGGQSFVPDLPATNAPQRFAPIFPDNTNKEPIRAYVVEADITDAQKRIARIERSTRF